MHQGLIRCPVRPIVQRDWTALVNPAPGVETREENRGRLDSVDPDLRKDQPAGRMHRSMPIEVIEHHCHRTLTLLDRFSRKESSGANSASRPAPVAQERTCV